MRKVITITATDRWPYLERLLEDLLLNDLEGWHIYIQCEPHGSQSNSYAAGMLDRRAADRGVAGIHVSINDHRLGVKDNPYDLLSRVFGDGVDYVLYLEEDLALSADVTLLADWYFEHRSGGDWGGGNPSEINIKPGTEDICCRLFHPAGANHQLDETANIVFPTECFSSLGFILDRSQWEQHFQPHWNDGRRGWDWAMQDYIDSHNGDRFCLCPVQGRSNHIGREGGTHCPPELHDSRYAHLEPYWGPKVTEFNLADRPEEIARK